MGGNDWLKGYYWETSDKQILKNQFDRICTIDARNLNPEFDWQSRFHDHIIRNEKSFERIRNYILTNPQNWEKDKFHCKFKETL